jgi:tRNA(Ile)-lysidine synthase
MNMLEEFKQHIKSSISPATRLLAAVSGGVDSVVLCDLLHKTGIDFSIAHCNFQLRGEESERDEFFVKSLAEKYQKEIFVQKFETKKYAEEKKVSTQVAARDLRYDWFNFLIGNMQYAMGNEQYAIGNEQYAIGNKQYAVSDFILTAHHADDNIETVVMNFFRGTGLKGLVGMDDVFQNIYRPLLSFRKEEILQYAKENNLDYVEDSSNASSTYTRNYFRNELIPAIAKVFANAEENILENIVRLKEVENIYNAAINKHKENLVEKKGSEEHIPILKLQKTPSFRTILWEIIKDKNFTSGQLDEVIKVMDSSNGSFIKSNTHRIIKNRKWLIIASIESREAKHIVIDESDKLVVFTEGKLELEKTINHQPPTANNIACFDLAKITFPLLLRKWKQGDYFYPLGMQKKKKLSRFFIDQKLSLTEKEKIWVIESDKKIIWVVNYRIDDRFKILPSTTNVLKISATSTLEK